MKITTNPTEEDFFDTETLAKLLDVDSDWLKHNRNSDNPIPYVRVGRRLIRYSKSDVLKWIGRNDLSLKYFSTKTLAQKLKVSDVWLKQNRSNNSPIPFRKFGYLVRYQGDEVTAWLRKNNMKVPDELN